jgi:hypothetical protein
MKNTSDYIKNEIEDLRFNYDYYDSNSGPFIHLEERILKRLLVIFENLEQNIMQTKEQIILTLLKEEKITKEQAITLYGETQQKVEEYALKINGKQILND